MPPFLPCDYDFQKPSTPGGHTEIVFLSHKWELGPQMNLWIGWGNLAAWERALPKNFPASRPLENRLNFILGTQSSRNSSKLSGVTIPVRAVG